MSWNFSNCRKKPEKNLRIDRIQTCASQILLGAITNWATKPHIRSKENLEGSSLPWKNLIKFVIQQISLSDSLLLKQLALTLEFMTCVEPNNRRLRCNFQHEP